MRATHSSITLRATVETDLPFVLTTETDPANSPYITIWAPEEHQSALRDANVGHWIIQSPCDQSPVGYLIAQGLTNTNGELYLKRLVVPAKHKDTGVKHFGLSTE